MKWVTLFSCLFLISFAESKHLNRKYRGVEPLINFAGFIPLPEQIIKLGIIALLSQFLQYATFKEIEKVAKDIVALAKACDTKRALEPRCEKYQGDIYADLLCQEPGLAKKYNFIDCCNATNQERYKCFLNHKNKPPGTIPPLEYKDIKLICKEFRADRDVFRANVAYDVARRYPVTSLYTIVNGVYDYSDVLSKCCLKAHKWPCFATKTAVIAAKFRDASLDQHNICIIEKKFKPETLFHCKFNELNRKFPRGSFSVLYYLAGKVQYLYEELCQGNTLQGFITKADIGHDICALRFNISSRLEDCCIRPIVEKLNCIEALREQGKPADLSPNVKEFIEDKMFQCQNENTTTWTKHLILYEFLKGRLELPMEPITQIYKQYILVLQKCCQTSQQGMCGAEAEKLLETQIAEILKNKTDTCIFYSSGKHFPYQDMLLHEFTKKLPQLPFENLYHHAKNFSEGVDKCCLSNDKQKLNCIERKVDAVLGDICKEHNDEPTGINPQIGQCCSRLPHCWLTCFHSLGVDESYDPVPFSAKPFDDLCVADYQHILKQRFLVNVIKYKPTITIDQRVSVMMALNGVLEKCCRAVKNWACVRTEVQKLINRIRNAFPSQV